MQVLVCLFGLVAFLGVKERVIRRVEGNGEGHNQWAGERATDGEKNEIRRERGMGREVVWLCVVHHIICLELTMHVLFYI